jgi:tetratricopeptide (TPR) repeat protein
MATTVKKHGIKGDTARMKRRPWLVPGTLLGGVLLAAGIAWIIWHQILSSPAPKAEMPILSPPALELAGIDPAVTRAIGRARAAVNQSPRSVQAWGLLGKTLLAHDFHIPAGICLAQAERLGPTDAHWPYLQGMALVLADPPDPDAAIHKFQRAVELGGDTPDALRLRLGEVLLGQDRLEEAEQQFQRIVQLDSANARANLGLARVALRRGDPEQSLGHLQPALGDSRVKKACRLLLAEVQQRLGKGPSAEALREVAQLPEDPGWPDPFWEEATRLKTGMKAQLYRAESWLRNGRIPDAIRLLQQTVRDYPDSYYAWLMFGRALTRQRNLKVAEQALNTALKLAPDSAETQFYLGVALFLQKDYRAAEALFRNAVKIKPDFAMAHYNFGCCLRQQGDRAGALEAFRVALQCKADYADAHSGLSDLLVKNGQYAEALVHARLALQSNPADATARKLVQRLLMQITIPTGP